MELPAAVVAATVDSLHPPNPCGMLMWRQWENKVKLYEIRVEDINQPNLKQTQNASTTKKNGPASFLHVFWASLSKQLISPKSNFGQVHWWHV